MERALAEDPGRAFVITLCLLMEEQTVWAMLKHQSCVLLNG